MGRDQSAGIGAFPASSRMPTQRGIDLISCGPSMKGLAFKAPSGVLLHPQPKVPRGIRNPAQPAPEPMPWAGFSLAARQS
jgi:hypothetical protein